MLYSRIKGGDTHHEDVNHRHVFLGAMEVPVLNTEGPILSTNEYLLKKTTALYIYFSGVATVWIHPKTSSALSATVRYCHSILRINHDSSYKMYSALGGSLSPSMATIHPFTDFSSSPKQTYTAATKVLFYWLVKPFISQLCPLCGAVPFATPGLSSMICLVLASSSPTS